MQSSASRELTCMGAPVLVGAGKFQEAIQTRIEATVKVNVVRKGVLLAGSVLTLSIATLSMSRPALADPGTCLENHLCWTSDGGTGVCGSILDCTCSGYGSCIY